MACWSKVEAGRKSEAFEQGLTLRARMQGKKSANSFNQPGFTENQVLQLLTQITAQPNPEHVAQFVNRYLKPPKQQGRKADLTNGGENSKAARFDDENDEPLLKKCKADLGNKGRGIRFFVDSVLLLATLAQTHGWRRTPRCSVRRLGSSLNPNG